MVPKALKRYAIVLAAWLPFFAVWVLFGVAYFHSTLSAALITSLISMGSASLLGIAAWHVCQRWPWPLRLSLKFYLIQMCFALIYALLWIAITRWLDVLRLGDKAMKGFWTSPLLGWELLTGIWLYGL